MRQPVHWRKCLICSPSSFQLCLGALSQPLSGCIRLLCPGALDPVCDPATLAPFPLSSLSLHPKPLPTCPPRRSRCGPPASRPAGRGRGPWRHGNLRRTQPPRHERCAPSRGQRSGVQLYPTSLQALQFACTLPAGQSHLSVWGKQLCLLLKSKISCNNGGFSACFR